MVILKTESQLKSFMTRKSPNNQEDNWGTDDCYSRYHCSVFLSGKKIVRCESTYGYGGYLDSAECKVIALYIPRVK